MIKNYFKTAWRHLARQKYYTLLNVIGLASSVAFALLISAYIWQEQQVNSGLSKIDNQYILQSDYKVSDIGIELTTIGALPKALKMEYPHLVSNYYRFDGITCIASHGEQVFQEEAALGDSTLLTMYGFELIDGDTRTALDAPFSVVVTAATAIKYFGRKDVVGETLSLRNFAGDERNFEVTGVLSDVSYNSITSLTPSMANTLFLSLGSADYFGRTVDDWKNPWIAGFVELQDGVTPEQLTLPLRQLLKTHADERVAANLTPVLKPLRTYYLEDNNSAVAKMIRTVAIVAAFILLMAVINFVNIRISQSMSRIQEIGVRKVLGSNRWQLILQLLCESLAIVTIASIMALGIYPILSPVFAKIFGKALPGLSDLPFYFYGYFLAGTVVMGIVASIYPALRLSSINMLYAMKGRLAGIMETHLTRTVLLTTQFVVAMVVLVGAVAVHTQVSLFFSDSLGYDKDYLITAQVPRDWTPEGLYRIETIRQQLSELPQVEQVSISYDIPSASGSGVVPAVQYGADENNSVALQLIISDAHFADTYKIPMVEGEFFSAEKSLRNSQAVVINRQAAHRLGYDNPKDAVGRQITLSGSDPVLVSGVTDDFYLHTMHSEQPAIVWVNVAASSRFRYFSVRLTPGNVAEAMKAIGNKWKKLLPDAPFEYRFMDETLEAMYQQELRLKRAANAATVFSVIIVILGIVGLVSMAIQKRMKELGVRKVLGASTCNIVGLFVKDFVRVYVLALILSIPLVYHMLHQWLGNYHHRIELGWWLFGWPLACLSILIISAIGLQGFRAALANPVDALRDE